MTKLYGLIGRPISHSLSPSYMQSKWKAEGVTDCVYRLFPLPSVTELGLLLEKYPELCGLNVTSPYKEEVLDYADIIDENASALQSANVLCICHGKITAHNTDMEGFNALLEAIPHPLPEQALILGSGGAARAACAALHSQGIRTAIVSRKGKLDYNHLTADTLKEYHLIVNATPIGMGPWQQQAPDIPYQAITPAHTLIDLIYNPSETPFLQFGRKQGAYTINGLPMFYAQADATWNIWKKEIHNF